MVGNCTVYVIYAITSEGKKDVLGLYLGETEGAKYWLQVLTELKNRGLEDIYGPPRICNNCFHIFSKKFIF